MSRYVGVVLLVLSQMVQSPLALLARSEPLSPRDIESVLDAIEPLLQGKSFFTYGGFGGGTITVGAGPRVASVYYGDRYVEWPGDVARRCDGADLEGELELSWESGRSGWVATARATSGPRLLDAMFELWSLEPDQVQDAGIQEIDGLMARGLRYPYRPPDGAQFESSWQSTWFDQLSGLPIRYEIEIEHPETGTYGYYFAFAPGWRAGPDSSVERPSCITWGR